MKKSLEHQVTERRFELANLSANALQTQIRVKLETLLGNPIDPSKLSETILDGKFLCQVLQKLFPDALPNYKIQPTTVPNFSQNLKNLTLFIEGCKKVGLKDMFLFSTSDILQKKDFKKVIGTLDQLFRLKDSKSNPLDLKKEAKSPSQSDAPSVNSVPFGNLNDPSSSTSKYDNLDHILKDETPILQSNKYLNNQTRDMKSTYENDESSLFQSSQNEHLVKKSKSENYFSLGITKPSNVLRQNFGVVVDTQSNDWNSLFQKLLEDTVLTPGEQVSRDHQISLLYDMFIRAATPIVKTLIFELELPVDQKTIKPIDAGGIAGGEKFVYNNMFFKFSKDSHGLYGGDHWAEKAAAHEFKSLMALMQCSISRLHLPLATVTHFMGHRLIISSILPITKSTLVMGSCNAADTITNSDPNMQSIMQQAASLLNLKPHKVEPLKGESQILYGPVDLEGHLGKDGRYYIIDTARLFPPAAIQTPNPKIPAQYLVQLLRPEFVSNKILNPNPLSSDAYSNFGSNGARIHNEEVRQATETLFTKVIPQFVSDHKDITLLATSISKELHQKGINIRYLGKLFYEFGKSSSNAYMKRIIASEAYTRAAKTILKNELRKYSSSEPKLFATIILEYLKLMFLNNDTNERYKLWIKRMESVLNLMFETQLSEILGFLDNSYIFSNLCEAMNIQFTEGKVEEIWKQINETKQIVIQAEQVIIEPHFKQLVTKPFMDTLRLRNEGRLSEAISYYDKEAEVRVKMFGENAEYLPLILKNKAQLLILDVKTAPQAIEVLEKALSIIKYNLDNNESTTMWSIWNYSEYCLDIGTIYEYNLANFEKAEEWYWKGVKTLEKTAHEKHVLMARLYMQIANIQRTYQKWEEAEKTVTKSQAIFEELFGADRITSTPVFSFLALLLQEQGKYAESEALYLKVIKVTIDNYGPNCANLGTLYDNLGLVYRFQGKLDVALETFVKGLRIREAYEGNFHSNVATSCNNIGSVLEDCGYGDDALKYYGRSLEIFKAIYGDHSTYVGSLKNNIGMIYMKKAMFKEAEAYFRDALEIIKAVYGESHSRVGNTLNNIGICYIRQLRFAEAEPYLLESYQLQIKSLGACHPLSIKSLGNLVELQVNLGKMNEGLQLVEKTFQMIVNSPDLNVTSLFSVVKIMIQLLIKSNQVEKAKQTIQTISTQKVVDFLPFGEGMINLMNLSFLQGSDELALFSMQVVIQKAVELYGENHPELVKYYVTMSRVCSSNKKFELALEFVNKAEKIQLASLPPDNISFCPIYNQFLMLYDEMNDLQKAEGYINKTVQILSSSGPNTDLATTFNSLGTIYWKHKLFDKSASYYQQCVEIWEKLYGAGCLHSAGPSGHLAACYIMMKEYEKAKTVYETILPNLARALNANSIEYIVHTLNYAKALGRLKDPKAEQVFLAALQTTKAANPTFLPQALGYLKEFYTETNQPEKYDQVMKSMGITLA